MRTRILYEDKDILVIQKPPGLATQTARVEQPDVTSELKKYLGSSYLGIVHRLDQPVEGLLVFGKNKAATAALAAQLRGKGESRELNKRYYCVFCGKAPESSAVLTDHLYRDSAGNTVVTGTDGARPDSGAKYASLKYQVIDTAELSLPDDTVLQESGLSLPIVLSLADVTIQTGRFHQIRAQFAAHGMSLLGDGRYGDSRSRRISQLLGIQGAALCAYRVDFIHPISRKPLCFQVRPEGPGFSFFTSFPR